MSLSFILCKPFIIVNLYYIINCFIISEDSWYLAEQLTKGREKEDDKSCGVGLVRRYIYSQGSARVETVQVAGICDVNEQAPGMVLAREIGVQAYRYRILAIPDRISL